MKFLTNRYKSTVDLKLLALFSIFLIFSWIISCVIVNFPPLEILFALLAVILFMVIFFNPLAGLMLLFFVIPFDDMGNFPISITKIVGLVFLVSWIARKAITRKGIGFPYNNPQVKYLICLMFVLTVSLFFSINKSTSLLFFQKFALLLALCVFLTDSIQSPKHLRRLAWVIGLSGGLAGLLGLIQSYGFGSGILGASQSVGSIQESQEDLVRVAGFAGNPNEFAINLVVSICFLLYCFSITKNLVLRILVIILIGLNTVAIVFSLSRSGMLALGIAAVIYGVRIKGLKLTAFLSLLIIGLAVMFIFKFTPDFVYDRLVNLTLFKKDESRENRVIVVKSGLSALFEQPLTLITGVGLGNFPEVAWARRDAHNMYLQMLVETGFIGFTFFFLLIYRTYKDIWNGTKLKQVELQLLYLSVLPALIAILVQGLFHTLTYIKYLWLFFALEPIIWKFKSRAYAQAKNSNFHVNVSEYPKAKHGYIHT